MNDDAVFYHIRAALRKAVGEGQAITLTQIAEYAQTSRRTVEMILEERLEDLGFVVVSGSPGYWRPQDADEVEHYLASLHSRLAKIAKRRRTIKRLAVQSGFAKHGKRVVNAPAPQREFLFESIETMQP